GCRPGRGAHDALRSLNHALVRGEVNWVLEADIKSFLDDASYCTSICGVIVEEAGQRIGNLDSQAFPSPAAHVNGGKFSALYTLQDRLARNAENSGCIDHGNVSLRRLIDKKRTQLICHANAPWSAGSELLAGDEAIVQPAVDG